MLEPEKSTMTIRFTLLSSYALVVSLIMINTCFAASSEEYVNSANEHIKKGDLRSAVIELKNALQKDGKNAKARVLLGETYLKLGDGASAEKELDRAKRLGENTHLVQVYLGRAYLLQGKADELLDNIKDNEKYTNKVRAEILTLNAQAYLIKRDREKAKQFYQNAIKMDPDSVNGHLGLARLEVLDRKLDQAEVLVISVIKKNEKSDEAWAVYGEIARLSGNQKLALERFNKALSLEPNNVAAKLGKVSASIALNDLETAINTSGEILKLIPNHPNANFLLAVAQFRKKDLDSAEESLNKVFKVVPSDIPSLQLMGVIHFSKGKYEQAGQAFTRVLAAIPSNIYATKLLAASRLKTNQPKQAIELLAPYEKNSNDAQLLSILGSAYLQNRENDKGMGLLEKALELDPNAAGIQTQLAMAQLMAGDNTKAIERLESAVELSPDLTQAETMLVLAQMKNRNYSKAVEAAKSLQVKNPNSPVPLNLIGASYLGLKDRQQARKQFEAALKLDPKFSAAAINLAKMDEQDGSIEKAIEKYNTVLKNSPGHMEALLNMARIAESQGRNEDAIRYVEKANDLNPGSILPALNLIQYYLGQKNTLKALSIARTLKDNVPDNYIVLKSLAMAQAANKEYSNALSTFQSMEKLQPDSPETHFLMAKVYFETGDDSAARKSIEKSLKLKSDYLPGQLMMIDMELKANHQEAAIKLARQIQKQSPKSHIGYQAEGDIYLKTRDYPKAIDKYKAALKKFENSELVARLSTAYDASGKNKENSKLLEGWVVKNPLDNKIILLLASHYQKINNKDNAIKYYLKSLEISPKNIVALNNVAWIYQQIKNPKAIEYAERAYDIAPDNPAIADTYGWLLVNEGDANKGLNILQQAVVQAPHMQEIHYHLAFGMFKTGRKNEARTELERLLKKGDDFPNADQAKSLLKQIKGG